MTDAAVPQPDWNLLPHNAEAFFELESGYSRRDLKRKYNRLIKVYKPEKTPAEFQKIRSAVEQLDNALRYGEKVAVRSAAPASAFDWSPEAGADSAAQVGVESRPAISPPQELAARLQKQSAIAVYQELSARTERTPFDYYALAVLSDTLPEFDPQRFLKWLLSGVRQFPDEPALLRMLYSYFRAELPAGSIRKILLVTARTVRNDRFYSLTEPLWDELLRTLPFDEFRRTLEKCESELQDFRVEGRVAFFLHILKAALWKADPDWIEAAFGFVDEHLDQASMMAEAEAEMLTALREYIAVRNTFLKGHPLRRQIDQAIQDYCLLPQPQNAHSYIECQLRMASNGGELLQAFPFTMSGIEDSASAMTQIWFWIAFDVYDGDREDSDDATNERKPTLGKLRLFLRSLDARTAASSLGRFWGAAGWCYGLTSLIGIFILAFFLTWFPLTLVLGDDAPVIRFVVSLAIGAGGGFALRQFVLPPLWLKFCLAMGVRCYENLWRREVQQFLRRTRLEITELLYSIQALGDDEELEYSMWVLHLTNADQALPLYVSAQRFLV